VGTHALIEDLVKFQKLALAVIDEQHRFGVKQRAKLQKKSTDPIHVLVMTATPIPRTLALSVYGDLDVSIIDELPPGRKPVQTLFFTESTRNKVIKLMKQQLAQKRQIYIVYPLISESEKLDLIALESGYEGVVRDFPMPPFEVGILHGRMKHDDKDRTMDRFKRGIADILVSTTVIEVGVDVPNASMMVIENAERFGLAQLHQLRGRVGRGADQSYCVLMGGNKLSDEGKARINAMLSSNDGFVIAEEDMKMRGPGDILGTRQSGELDFKWLDLIRDFKIINYAKKLAAEIVEDDPELVKPENQCLRNAFIQYGGKNSFLNIA
jgi:ATP-dependent DNA helicase RecG